MLPVLTAAQMADLDRYTIETLKLDGKLLMSNAAREVLRVLRYRFPDAKRPVIFAGTGNNGGDGVALAYYAQQEGLSPTLVLCHPEISDPPKLSEDSGYFFRIANRAYVPVLFLPNPALAPEAIKNNRSDLVVDALFGTGLDRPLSDYYLSLLERLNLASCPRLAVDCPSGLNCSTGQIMDGALLADVTVTMGYPKLGFYHPGAARYLGDLHVVQLGFATLSEAGVQPSAHAWPDALWSPLTELRAPDTHKGHYGRVLVVAGHKRYPGAPRLAARAALRSGAGLVRLVVPEPIYTACCGDPSVMVDAHPADDAGGFAAEPSGTLLEYLEWADALVLGPGLSDGEAPIALARTLLTKRSLPTVLDADGLRALPTEGERGRWPLVLTPHVGELARLAGVIPDEAWEHWFERVPQLAAEHDALLLAKSNQCLLATPGGALIFPEAGHPALASGGTGDVLSGIIGALLARLHAQEHDPVVRMKHNDAGVRLAMAEVVATAVNIHSAAAHVAVDDLGEESLTATDLVEYIPDGMAELLTDY